MDMDSVRYLYRRSISLLLCDHRRKKTFTDGNTGSGRRIQRTPESAAERVFSITELALLVLQLAPPRTWPTLCLVNWDCAELVQPLIWKTVACHSSDTSMKIRPHIRKLIHHVETLNLDSLPQPSVSNLLQELSAFEQLANITSLSLRHSQITSDQLLVLLAKLPHLKEIDIQGCVLQKHPLEVLAWCKDIESMAFSQENVLLSTAHGQKNIFDLWARLRRLNVNVEDTAKHLSVLQIDETISRCQLNLESLHMSTYREFRAPTLPSACLRSVTFHAGITQYFQKHFQLIRACPLIQDIDLAGFRIDDNQFKAIAEASKGLVSLTLKRCIYPTSGLRHFLDLCAGLERLNAEGIDGAGGVVALFKEPSWSCRDKLQELTLSIVWGSGDMQQPADILGGHFTTMWNTVDKLCRLRVLSLEHLNRTDCFGTGIQWGAGLPRRLEKLCLTGHREWKQEEIIWITENLEQLDELEYDSKEMDRISTFLIERVRPDVRLIARGVAGV
ncbi:MAG: hypothetical protein J3Q66DRAFT_356796 [Benniella sp.]|nr:MAG: hypothetical protein J3Q66DRAFT_356796 [Benniella sp.]